MLKWQSLKNVLVTVILGVKMGSNKIFLLAVVAGILEFIVTCMLFLMAGFSLTGFAVFSRLAVVGYAKDPVSRAQLYLGIGAAIGFLVGLAGSVSAMERKRWFLTIIASLTTGFWGVLMCFYTLLALMAIPELVPDLTVDQASVNVGLSIGTIAIGFSAISCLLVIIARHEFKPPKLGE
jgi:hypothetical protein